MAEPGCFSLKNADAIANYNVDGNIHKGSDRTHSQFIQNGYNCSWKSVNVKLHKLVKTWKDLKQRRRDQHKVDRLLASEFTIKRIADPVAGPSASEEDSLPMETDPPRIETVPLAETQLPTLRGDCQKCEAVRTESRIKVETVTEYNSRLRRKVSLYSTKYKVRVVNQFKKRRNDSTKKSSAEMQQLKNENVLLERRVKNLQLIEDQHKYINTLKKEQRRKVNAEVALGKLKRKCSNLEKELEEEKERVRVLENDLLIEKEKNRDDVDDSKGGVYQADMRLCAFKCLLSNVAVERTGDLIRFISSIMNDTQLSHVPGPTTVSRMVYEMGVLSDLQTGAALYKSINTALAWDATSIGGTHVNEVHVHTSDEETLYLQIGHLPGGRTADYYDHIADTLKDIATTYASYSGLEVRDVLHTFYTGITCSLSDRAAVNSCVSAEISKLMNKDLIFINCNVHPLDGLASGTRKSLSARDKALGTSSAVFGSECRVANFIYCMGKMRYNASCGDPAGFELLLSHEGLPKSILPRYVGNRLHLLFHSAGIVFHLRSMLTLYLEKKCAAGNLRTALLGDIKKEEMLAQLKVLGLFGKVLTGPWMTKFYKNEDAKKHLEMNPFMETSIQSLEDYEKTPSTLLTASKTVFGEVIDPVSDPVFTSLTDDSFSPPQLSDLIVCVASSMKHTLKKQLAPYLQGGRLSNPSDTLLEKTSSAPLHNIAAERCLGMFDALTRRAPNASVGFIDCKVRATLNKTLPYILKQDEGTRESMINFAIKHGCEAKKKRTETTRKNTETGYERQKEKAHQRETTQRRKLEREMKASIEKGDIDGVVARVPIVAQEFVSSILKQEIPTGIFEHVWELDGVDTTYTLTVEGFHQHKKDLVVDVCYAGTGHSTLTVQQFVADVILGDLVQGAETSSADH